jgi:hypothetical protein
MSEIRDTLRAIERQFWAGDLAVYVDNVDGQCMLLTPKWEGVYAHEDFATYGSDSEKWSEVDIQVEDFLHPIADVAIIMYQVKAAGRKGKSYQGTAISSYVNRGGVWKLVSHQRTPLE